MLTKKMFVGSRRGLVRDVVALPRLPLWALAAFAVSSVAAAPQPYMQRAKRDELPLLIESSGCPVDAAAVRAMAEGVMSQSSIKSIDPATVEVPPAFPWLYVNLQCLDNGAVFRTDVDFVGLNGAELTRFALNGYGGLGSAARDGAYILDGLKQHVEAAIKDYIEANRAADSTPRRR